MNKQEINDNFRRDTIKRALSLLSKKAYRVPELAIEIGISEQVTRKNMLALFEKDYVLAGISKGNKTVYFCHADNPELMPKNCVRKLKKNEGNVSKLPDWPPLALQWAGYLERKAA